MIKNYPTLKNLAPLFLFIIFLLFSVQSKAQYQNSAFISVSNISSPVCAGSEITVNFTAKNGNKTNEYYNNSSIYSVYISDALGNLLLLKDFSTSGVSYCGIDNCITTLQTNVTIPANYLSGNYTIRIYSTLPYNAWFSPSNSFTVNPLPVAAGTITGTATVCQSQNNVSYSVPVIANATSYTWAYSGTGATISGTTNSISINFAANATSGNLTVRGTNACGNGTVSANYAITVNPLPATSGAITGTVTQFPALTGQIYSIAAVLNATTYNWTVPIGWLITAGAGTTSITVTTGNVGDNGNITVSAQNTCGTSALSTLAVTVIASQIDFDGTDDYVDFGDNHDFTGSFSLEAWVLEEVRSTTSSVISKRDALATNLRGYHLSLNNGFPNLTWYDNAGNAIINMTAPIAISTNIWHHLAATFDGATAKLYADGILVDSATTATPPVNGTEKFIVGAMYDSSTPTLPKNYFNGNIDEVRVWNVALTAQQLREMMNQEIKENAPDVEGITIPLAITDGLLWSNLKGYYPMNDDTANDKSGNAVNGTPKNISSSQPQTAPLPYKSLAGGAWSTPATWLNSVVQNTPNSLINLNGIDTEVTWNIVETSHNISSTGNKTLLGLIVNSVSTITAGNNSKIEVSHYLKLDGIIDLQGKSQLVQTLNSELAPTSAGHIKRNQQGVGNKYSYNYWSSPVGPLNAATNNNNYTVKGVFKQGLDNAFVNTTNQDITWIGGYDGNINGSDQISLARYWLWKFANGTVYSNWAKIDENSALIPSQGFTVKGAGAVDSGVQNYTFVGKPHNGNIALNSVLANNYFLVGNPYPSALDGKQFIADNKDVITGTIYFWEQSSTNNTHNLAGYTGGYSTLSSTGGIGPIVPAGISGLGGIVKVPNQFIPVGQGFYVIGKAGMSSAQPILFNNGQRKFEKEDSLLSTTLFKNEAATKGKTQFDHFNDNSNDPIIDEKLVKIRLGFNTTDKFHRQLLLGFMNEKATDGDDYGYDAVQIDSRANDMFFPINNSKFIIQGVGYFDVNKIYPLGISITIGGNVQFVLDEVLNLPSDVSICVFDKLTDETHNISKKPFEINLEMGTYLDRFALTFKMHKLVAENVVAEVLIPAVAQPVIEGIHVFMNNAIGELQIKNNSTEEIVSVALINSLGQTIKTWNSNFNIRTISLPISTATGVYLVQINTKTGKTVKKISVE